MSADAVGGGQYRVSRRRFLAAGAAALAAAGVGSACGSGGDGEAPETTTAVAPVLAGDEAVANLIAGLENLAVDAYDALLAAASAGGLGAVPAIVGAVVGAARAHHIEHLAVWNGVLRGADRPEVDAADVGLQPTLDGMVAEVTNVGGVIRLALLVEEILADTYLKAIPTLVDRDSVRAAALILATDQQHQAVLRYALGENPVPEPLQIPDKAAS